MASGKHASNQGFEFESIPWKKIVLIIVIIMVIIGVLFGGKTVYSSFIANGSFFNNKKIDNKDNNLAIEEEMPTELYGYKVLGEMKIESQKYSGYILDYGSDSVYNKKDDTEIGDSQELTSDELADDTTSKNISEKVSDALNKGLVKLYGNKLNQKGNFTIMGHNQEKYFAILNELKIDDEIYIKTVSNIEKKYIVTEIYTIEPDDLKALMPNEEFTEVTLITCKTGSNERLVVKTIEETDYEIFKVLPKESDVSNDLENVQNTVNSME